MGFNFKNMADAPVSQAAEETMTKAFTPSQEEQPTVNIQSQPATVAEQPTTSTPLGPQGRLPKQEHLTPATPRKTKKTENGIVINVPMEDYMKLAMIKMQTSRTLKDLALQAIHEFVERYENEG